MEPITHDFKINFEPHADPKAIVRYNNVRFTVLTSRLIRMEYSAAKTFEDRPSQVIWYRKLSVPSFNVIESETMLEVITKDLHLRFIQNSEGFTDWSLSVEMLNFGETWHYGDKDSQNLKGTVRTLDNVKEPIKLEDGLVSKAGWSIIDDTDSLVFNQEGWLTPRSKNKNHYKDLYFFGYGLAYQDCLSDYFALTGKVPMLPRWSLGNWWSRYWEYTQQELLHLMYEFKTRQIPLSVDIVDMDWHVVDIEAYVQSYLQNKALDDIEFHSGWTGFTWNEQLFPDYKSFLQEMKEDLQLKVALNLHPALGVHAHEAQYEDVAKEMGVDPSSKEPIDFDIANPTFAKAYFNHLLHPYEIHGIDFWWVDWQQGRESSIKGLDPLYWLNHLHYYDLKSRKETHPIIFSRYGGLGSHRYPIGFSGDTYVNWEVLQFMPYFTATASNVGYSWWSHDLGGHMSGEGISDPELYIRWLQFGLCSPIFRLHSSKNTFLEKLPWKFENEEVYHIAKQIMRYRHALIPYLYSMAWKNHKDNLALIRPMYHHYPRIETAYHSPNQYYFGTELLCSPIVDPLKKEVDFARQKVWLPEGIWFDYWTGEYYEGNKEIVIYGDLTKIPIFAKAGAIVPLTDMENEEKKNNWNVVNNPSHLELIVFPGATNTFHLYEDDGIQTSRGGTFTITEITQEWTTNQLRLNIQLKNGEKTYQDVLPIERTYNICIKSIKEPDEIHIKINNNTIESFAQYDSETDSLLLKNINLAITDAMTVKIKKNNEKLMSTKDRTQQKLNHVIKRMKTSIEVKTFLTANLQDIIRASREFVELTTSFLEQQLQSKELNTESFSLTKRYLPKVQKLLFLQPLIEKMDNYTQLKHQLSTIMENMGENLEPFLWNLRQQCVITEGIFNLTHNQLQALIELSTPQIELN